MLIINKSFFESLLNLFVLFFIIKLFLAPTKCRADTVEINRPSSALIIQGKFLELRNGILSFLCDDGSIANVKWEEIRSLTINDKLFTLIDSQETIYGYITIQNDKVQIASPSLGKMILFKSQIKSLERKRKETAPVFTVSNEMALASVRGKGTESSSGGKTDPIRNANGTQTSSQNSTKAAEADSKSSRDIPTIGEKTPERIPEEMFLRGEKVLIPKGRGEIELNLTYVNRDKTDLFGADKTRSLVPALTGRYGITNDLMAFATIPFVFNWHEVPGEGESSSTRNYRNAGLGDIFFGLNYQLLYESIKWPSLMLSLSAKSNTGKSPYVMPDYREKLGTGHWEISPGFSLVRTIDPVVLFGSFYYTYSFSRMINQASETAEGEEQITRVRKKPGDSVNLVLGTGFAFNEKVTMSFRTVGSFIFRDQINNRETGELQTPFYQYIILDYLFQKYGYLEPAIAFGLTRDASDFLLSLSYVYRFY